MTQRKTCDLCDRPASVTRAVEERKSGVLHVRYLTLCAKCMIAYDQHNKPQK